MGTTRLGVTSRRLGKEREWNASPARMPSFCRLPPLGRRSPRPASGLRRAPVDEGDDDSELGNKIANMFVALPVQLEDPGERLAAVHRSAMNAKEMTKAVRARRIQAIAGSAPPALINLAFRTMFSAGLDQLLPATANVLVSNVPGPPIPLYSAGARVRAIYPIGPLMMGMGLNFTVMSYIDSVDFGLQCDPMLLPDPWVISGRVPDALAELMKAKPPMV
jgi:diacylglycerol O-acyltransferase / wax synthase